MSQNGYGYKYFITYIYIYIYIRVQRRLRPGRPRSLARLGAASVMVQAQGETLCLPRSATNHPSTRTARELGRGSRDKSWRVASKQRANIYTHCTHLPLPAHDEQAAMETHSGLCDASHLPKRCGTHSAWQSPHTAAHRQKGIGGENRSAPVRVTVGQEFDRRLFITRLIIGSLGHRKRA